MKRISIIGGQPIEPVSVMQGVVVDRSAPGTLAGNGVRDIHVADGRILAIGAPPAGFEAEQRIDARGLWVLPGLVDACARLREPGFEYKASLESELAAAAAGGITNLCCPPDTDPPLDEPGLIEMLRHRARQERGTRLHPLGALTVGLNGEVLTEMAELAEAGCVGFSDGNRLPRDTRTLMHAMQYAATFGFTVWLHPQDPWLARGGVAHSGVVASRLGLSGVPVIAETVALHTVFELVRQTGCRVHLCRMSSAAGVQLMREARAEGLPVSCDVAVHHLHLTDMDIGHFDSRLRVDPPFRAQRDRDALRAGVADGTIGVICSDHTPVDDDGKHLPFAEAEPGLTGVELLLPLILKWAREAGIEPARALAPATVDAARLLGIEAGSLAAGSPADLCLFDPDAWWTPGAATLRSQCTQSPWRGIELQGRVREVLVGGEVIVPRVGANAA